VRGERGSFAPGPFLLLENEGEVCSCETFAGFF
jgi:hypothetical protein